MITKVFSVFDTKAMTYLPVFEARTSAEALRTFESTVKKSGTLLSQYPTDYNLVELGEFNQEKGILIPHLQIITLANASQFAPMPPQNHGDSMTAPQFT